MSPLPRPTPRMDPHSPGNLGTIPSDVSGVGRDPDVGPDPDPGPRQITGSCSGGWGGQDPPPVRTGWGGAGIPTTAPARRPRLGALGKRRLSQQRQECARAQAKVGAAGWGGQGGQEWGTWGGGDPNTPPQDPPGGSVPPTHPEEAPDGRQVSGTRRPLRFWHLFPYLAPHPLLSPGGSHAGVPPSCPPALTQLIRTILGVPEPGSGTRHSPYMTLPTENFPASSSGPPAVRRGGSEGVQGNSGDPPILPGSVAPGTSGIQELEVVVLLIAKDGPGGGERGSGWGSR